MSAISQYARSGAKADVTSRNAPAQAWCYLCGSAHRFEEPHLRRIDPEKAVVYRCAHCGTGFEQRPGLRRRVYCLPGCRMAARLARRRPARRIEGGRGPYRRKS